MREKVLTWLSSLRLRLIVTYMVVIVFSFALLLVLVMEQVEKTIMQREEDKLAAVAITLGSTISTPWNNETAYDRDLFWTQRRCRLFLQESLPQTHFRILDEQGNILVDSRFPVESAQDWEEWRNARVHLPALRTWDTAEVAEAMAGRIGSVKRISRDTVDGTDSYRLFIAVPILRQSQRVAFIVYLDRPLTSVMRDVHDVRNRILRDGMLVSLLITILVSIFLSSHLSAGLNSAMRVARAFAAGHMEERMRARGYDEVGLLGAAFNQMADALQRQEELRRNLLADVSHELRTPLTAISACADTLADGASRDDPKATERFLSIIQRESQRLQRLVSDILELSKLQAGVIAIPLSPVSVCNFIEDIVDVARLHARQDGMHIRCEYPDCPDEDLWLLGNEDRMAQALRNLLDNARHHTPRGKTITVSVEKTPDTIVIHVQDEGEGIPAEELAGVFDRFYRAGKGEKSPGGSGLGLAIVREIMLAHHGHITIESIIGTGTRFSLHLQRVQAESVSQLTRR